MNIKDITESNFKDLVGQKLFYVGSETMPNIPFNIVGLDWPETGLNVETWEGRGGLNNRLMGRVKDTFRPSTIIAMIQKGVLTTKKSK